MQFYLDQLSTDLTYESHSQSDGVLTIRCSMSRNASYAVRGYYVRKIRDLNFGSLKVVLLVRCVKYYRDRKAGPGSFTEPLPFADIRLCRTKRLSEFILDSMRESSAIGLERTIRRNTADISDSTILRIVKKNGPRSTAPDTPPSA